MSEMTAERCLFAKLMGNTTKYYWCEQFNEAVDHHSCWGCILFFKIDDDEDDDTESL